MTREGGFLYGRNPIGRNLREELLVGGIPFRRNPVGEESSMGWNLCGRNPVGRISVVRLFCCEEFCCEEFCCEEFHAHGMNQLYLVIKDSFTSFTRMKAIASLFGPFICPLSPTILYQPLPII